MGLEDYKPAIVMIGCQFIYSGMNLIGRGALLQGMSSRVFIAYRQCIAFMLIAPFAYFQRRETKRSLEWKSFWLIFLLAFIGVTLNQNFYFEGIHLASSPVASAMLNLIPAVTFVVAYTIGLEKLHLQSLRSLAKIIGTIFCVTGAAAMALVKGPKLLNMELMPRNSLFKREEKDTWLLGCLFLLGSACFWSLWLILQVPVCAIHPDHLSLAAWMCLFAAMQSGFLALIFEPNMNAWKLTSSLEIFCCFYGGSASAVTFFAQAWCIAKRGPLFSAMFTPLCTVMVTIYACIFLHEELYTGSLVGALAVITGLYIVLWGKANDYQEMKELETIDQMKKQPYDQTVGDAKLSDTYKIDLEEPFMHENPARFGDETRDR